MGLLRRKSKEKKLAEIEKDIRSLTAEIVRVEKETRALHKTVDKKPQDKEGLREAIAKNNNLLTELGRELKSLRAKRAKLTK